jgi:hypothetical protein
MLSRLGKGWLVFSHMMLCESDDCLLFPIPSAVSMNSSATKWTLESGKVPKKHLFCFCYVYPAIKSTLFIIAIFCQAGWLDFVHSAWKHKRKFSHFPHIASGTGDSLLSLSSSLPLIFSPKHGWSELPPSHRIKGLVRVSEAGGSCAT